MSLGDHAARLRVHGPRRWEPALSFLAPTWKLGEAAPAASVALDYRLAAGGYHLGDAEGRYDRRNPIGPGVLRRDASRVGQTDDRSHVKGSIVLASYGDEPGVGGGVMSGTTGAECTPKTWSESLL